MRFKKYSFKKKISIGKEIKKICKINKVKLIINDDPWLTSTIKADGCHLGQNDTNIKKARKVLGNKIIGITCHNSIKLAKKAIRSGASYLAFGAFYPTKTKKTKYQASTKILKQVSKLTKIPLIAIGGINSKNYKNLLLNNANLLAISSFIWKNKKLKPEKAIRKIK